MNNVNEKLLKKAYKAIEPIANNGRLSREQARRFIKLWLGDVNNLSKPIQKVIEEFLENFKEFNKGRLK